MRASPPDENHDDLDKIGDWSVDKLEILKAYAEQYSLILKSQVTAKGDSRRFHFGYIDGFAEAGEHVHKDTGKIIPGSPLNALDQSFDEYHFIDLDPQRVARLKEKCSGVANAFVHHGDCNAVLLDTVFPRFKYENYRRALCFLDPYGMHLQWKVLATAGQMKTTEIFLNFPVMDINRNAKKRHLAEVDPDHRARMTAFWGDESWHAAMYAPSPQANFFGQLAGEGENSPEMDKMDNDAFVTAFRKRLREVAGFEFVPQPVPMKNSKNAVVYYLFFASNNATGNRIASHIFKGYR
ncbi:MAG: three-Cys-motif partner protein TcmP [Opitutaceae bacterium]